jgi:hypothetical protein
MILFREFNAASSNSRLIVLKRSQLCRMQTTATTIRSFRRKSIQECKSYDRVEADFNNVFDLVIAFFSQVWSAQRTSGAEERDTLHPERVMLQGFWLMTPCRLSAAVPLKGGQ